MRPIVWIVGLLGGGVALYLYENKASAATPPAPLIPVTPPGGAPGAPPLLPPVTPPNVTPPVIPNPGSGSEYQPATFLAAQALDKTLLASGCSTSPNGVVAGFQTAFQADPAGGKLLGGVDGLYGPATATALQQVLGTTAVVPPCVSDK